MICHCEGHVVLLPFPGLLIGFDTLFMLLHFGCEFSDLVTHHIEYILFDTFTEENSIVQLHYLMLAPLYSFVVFLLLNRGMCASILHCFD